MPSRSDKTSASSEPSALRASAGTITQRSPLHSPSGLSSQPDCARRSSAPMTGDEMSTQEDYSERRWSAAATIASASSTASSGITNRSNAAQIVFENG